MIHRSLLFDAINEWRQEKETLLRQILEALTAMKKSTHVRDSSQNLITGKNVERTREELLENPEDKQEEEKSEETKDPYIKKETDASTEKVSQVVAALEKLDQVHREENKILVAANKDLQNPEVTKVSKMQRKIQSVKENLLGTKENKEVHLLDQPNSEGETVMHIATSMDDDEATRLLLDHGANPNVQDAAGRSPLHIICNQRDIQTATRIINQNGRILENKQKETPALDELFFDQMEEKVQKLMEAVTQSNHRREILEEVLRKKHLLFRLVGEDKSETLSIVLKKLSKDEQEYYVNLVRDVRDGNTCLHLASSSKSLSCTSILLEAGAKLKTNAAGRLPKIEDFFTKENEDQITSALVDGVVERVEANQLDQEKALKLLIPDDEERKIHFQKASGKNWALIAQWETGWRKKKVDFSRVVPRLSVSELQRMVEVARDGHWEKEKVFALLCNQDKDGRLFLSHLGFNIQTEAAVWNKARTCLFVPWLGSKLREWIYQEATEGRWDPGMVFRFLERKEKDGAQAVSSRIHTGMNIKHQKRLA